MCPVSLACYLLGDKARDSSSSTGHVYDGQGGIMGTCSKGGERVPDKRAIDCRIECMRRERLKGKLVGFFRFNQSHGCSLLSDRQYYGFREELHPSCFTARCASSSHHQHRVSDL